MILMIWKTGSLFIYKRNLIDKSLMREISLVGHQEYQLIIENNPLLSWVVSFREMYNDRIMMIVNNGIKCH